MLVIAQTLIAMLGLAQPLMLVEVQAIAAIGDGPVVLASPDR